MAKVFISYSRKDIDFAKRLTGELQKSDLDFWIDWEGIPPTVDWWKEIQKGIEEADIFLFLISPDSAKSKICGQEIDTAVKNGKRIIPIVLREIQWEDTPPQLGHLNYIFFSRDDNFDTAVKKLMNAIQTDYEWAATHRRLQVKALEWERKNKENSFLLRGKDLQEAELQLAINSSKDPKPTDLQREYVFNSRSTADQQRRITTGISIAAAIALAALAVFGFYQAGQATKNADESQANLIVAQTAQVDAQNNAATAIANEQEARRQAQIALARQVAIPAQLLYSTKGVQPSLPVLLAIQSMKLFPNPDATYVLQHNLLAKPLARISISADPIVAVKFSRDANYVIFDGNQVWDIKQEKEITLLVNKMDVTAFDTSQDGKLLVTGDNIGFVHIWDLHNGNEIQRINHGGIIISVAISPDGKLVASSSSHSTDKVWDTTSGREVFSVKYDPGFVTSSTWVFSSDGKYAASAGGDYMVRIWETITGVELATAEYNSYRASAMLFSPDGEFLFVATSNSILVLDSGTGSVVAFLDQGGVITSMTISPDGKYMASGSSDGWIRLWDVASSDQVSEMNQDASVTSIIFSPDSMYLASGSQDGTVREWDPQTGHELFRIAHSASVSSVMYSSDGKYGMSVSVDGVLQTWESSPNNRYIQIEEDPTKHVTAITFSPDGKYLISGSMDNTLRMWNYITGTEVTRMEHNGAVSSITFSPDGRRMVSVSDYGPVRVWDITSGSEVVNFSFGDFVDKVSFTSDGQYLVAAGHYGTAKIWEISTTNLIADMDMHIEFGRYNYFVPVAISPNGHYVAFADFKDVRIWEALSGTEIALVISEEEVTLLSFSQDGKHLIVNGSHVWETRTGKKVASLNLTGNSVSSFAVSPENGLAVTSDTLGTAHVWEIKTGDEIARMTPGDAFLALAFSPDGKYIASGSEEGNSRIWETASGVEVARFSQDPVQYFDSEKLDFIGFSPNGKYVVSMQWDGRANIWQWQPGDLISDGCSRVSRNLTRSEWKQYIGDALPYQAVCENLPIQPEVSFTLTSTP